MRHWLIKSEPSTFSIDDLAQRKGKRTCWDGVRNYQARNFMRDGMRKGDLAFFYHSSCDPVGIVEIVRAAYPDHTALDPEDAHYDPKSRPGRPIWFMVDVKLKRRFDEMISLAKLKAHASSALSDLVLLRRGNRLSVMPVTNTEWDFILSLEK